MKRKELIEIIESRIISEYEEYHKTHVNFASVAARKILSTIELEIKKGSCKDCKYLDYYCDNINK